MTKRRVSRESRQNGTAGPILRPLAWSALLSAAVAVAFASPVYADPVTVPDTGTRPVPAGALRLPGVAAAPGTPAGVSLPSLLNGPLAAQIYAKEIEVTALGDQVRKLGEERDTALAARAVAENDWRVAREAVARAEEFAASAAAEALKDAAGLPPGMYGSDLHGLSELNRIHKGEENDADTSVAAREVALAQSAEQAAHEAFLVAETRVQTLSTQYTTLEAARAKAEAEFKKLKQDNAEQVAAIEREQEALDQRLGQRFVGAEAVAGKVANPKAVAAVRYALDQLGDPYLWAAEGPDRFDCSGLMWAAYRSVGYRSLPRVSRDQYYATRGKTVDRAALLPGDLIFFASGASWTSIHHVGMYIGGGKMVHAPTTGDVVKVSTVRWSRFYAATRIFDAVPAPPTSPTPSPSPSGSPSPTPSPTRPHSPVPTRTTRPLPTTTTSPTETTSPSPSPTETSSPSATGTTGPSTGSSPDGASAAASTSPSESESATPVSSPTASTGS